MTCDFQQCGILTSVDSDEPMQPIFSLETPNNVQSVAKGVDKTARMRRLIRGYAGCTYVPHCWKSHVTAQLCLGEGSIV